MYTSFIFLLLLSLPLRLIASETVGTIVADAHIWGDRLGWVVVVQGVGNPVVTDTKPTGQLWSREYGWINLNPLGAGVTNTAQGVLGGYAWASSLGWLSFAGARISEEGKFEGVTVGREDTGQLSFDCSECHMTTDWRPLSVRAKDEPILFAEGDERHQKLELPLSSVYTFFEEAIPRTASLAGAVHLHPRAQKRSLETRAPALVTAHMPSTRLVLMGLLITALGLVVLILYARPRFITKT